MYLYISKMKVGVGWNRGAAGYFDKAIKPYQFGSHLYLARHRLALVPPNPKLFVIAALTERFCGTVGM